MPGGDVHSPGQRFHVERLRVLTIDPIAHPSQQGEVAQALRCVGLSGHAPNRATPGAARTVTGRSRRDIGFVVPRAGNHNSKGTAA